MYCVIDLEHLLIAWQHCLRTGSRSVVASDAAAY